MKFIVGVGALLSMSACMTFQKYVEPPEGATSAELHLQRKDGEPAGPMGGAGHGFFVYDNAGCVENTNSGFLGGIGWDSASELDHAIVAERPIFLRMNVRYLGGGDATSLYSRVQCTSVAQFTPRAGASYVAYHDTFSRTCPATVIDKATGIAPPDFKLIPIEGLCGQFNT